MDYYDIDQLLALNTPVEVKFHVPFKTDLNLFQAEFFIQNNYCDLILDCPFSDLNACAGIVHLEDTFFEKISILIQISNLNIFDKTMDEYFLEIYKNRFSYFLSNKFLEKKNFNEDYIIQCTFSEKRMWREGWKKFKMYSRIE